MKRRTGFARPRASDFDRRKAGPEQAPRLRFHRGCHSCPCHSDRISFEPLSRPASMGPAPREPADHGFRRTQDSQHAQFCGPAYPSSAPVRRDRVLYCLCGEYCKSLGGTPMTSIRGLEFVSTGYREFAPMAPPTTAEQQEASGRSSWMLSGWTPGLGSELISQASQATRRDGRAHVSGGGG